MTTPGDGENPDAVEGSDRGNESEQTWRDDLLATTTDAGRSIGRAIFGDRTGLVLWLGLVLTLALLWRIGIFLTDTYTVANTLVNVADGHLAITKVEYSLTLGTQPGLHQYEGVLYGRNYGQAFFALPFLWLLQALAVVAEPRFVLLSGWALGVVAFSRQLGFLLERRGVFDRRDVLDRPGSFDSRAVVTIVGSAIAILAVLVGVRWGTPLDPDMLALAALQLSTIVAAASVGLVAYRLLATFEGTTVGVATGVAAGVATPVGFWASIPKRHVLVSALVLATVYCFARSRRTESRRLRAGAYAFAGLVTWIHAFEGFFLVVALGSVDLATARSNGWRDLAVVALVLLLALTPTVATNTAITGNPLQSPRLLPSVGVGGVEMAPGGNLQAGGTASGIRTGGGGGDFVGNGDATAGNDGPTGDDNVPDSGGDTGGPIGWLVGLFAALASALVGLLPRPPDSVLVILSFILSTVTEGLAALSDFDRLWHVFVRSGHVPGVRYAVNQFEVIELSVLESMPLLGALVAVPIILVSKVRTAGRSLLRWPRAASPARQTDLLVATITAMFTVVYLSRLPLHTMLTVRYLLPVYPLALYGVARLGPVSMAISGSPRTLAIAYAGTVVVGGAILLSALSILDPALGEAVQFHALLNLATAMVLAIAVLGRSVVPDRIDSRWVTTTLGLAAGATTIYLVLAGLAYFTYGSFAFDAVDMLAELLASVV